MRSYILELLVGDAMRIAMMKRIFMTLSLLMILAAANPSLAQENGSIKGVVVDETTGDGLISATVRLVGTKKGARTDVKGNYRINAVPPGEYAIQIKYVGYQTKEITGISVGPGQTVTVEVTMNLDNKMTEEVVVTARKINETGAALLKERQKAESVSDAIGAEEISRGGSSDAADAIKKVTGATTVGGKHVYIRGLGDRYSSTQLNGANLPSADPDKKSVHLDLFPSELIENIVTTKTATPDKPGDFTGGAVNISTKSFPDKMTVKFKMSGEYNTVTTGNSMLTTETSGTDWLGFDDGYRDVPSAIQNRYSVPEFIDDGEGGMIQNPDYGFPSIRNARQRGTYPQAGPDLDMLSKAFRREFAPSNTNAPLNGSYAVSIGNRHELFGKEFGYLASLSYASKQVNYEEGVLGVYSQATEGSTRLESDYYASMLHSKQEVGWGGMVNMAMNVTDHSKIALNFMRNQNGENEAVYQDGYREYYQQNMETRVLRYTERAITALQLSGEHNIPSFGQSKLDWNVSVSQNTQDEPNFRTFDNEYDIEKDSEGNVTDTSYSMPRSDNNAYPSHYFRDLSEDLYGGTLNYEIPFNDVFGSPFKFKTGGLYNKKERTFNEKRFGYQEDLETLSYEGNPNEFMQQNTGIIDEYTTDTKYRFGQYLEDRTRPSGSYTGEQNIWAVYGMIDWFIVHNFRVVGGVRYESTDMNTVSRDTTRSQGNVDEKDVLPSVNLTYNVTKDMNVRLAYGKTLARPTFREIAPYDNYMPINHYTYLGNDSLQRTLIDNFDLRWEWFTNPGEIISVGGFYKMFTNPIELAIVNVNNNVQPVNVGEAFLYGIEFEYRKNLAFITEDLSDLNFGMNLTLVHSEVDLPDHEYESRKQFDPGVSKTRELQGQSPYVINFDLSYTNLETGTEANVHYNIFGKRLSEVGYGAPDYYEFPKPELSLVVSQKFFEHFKAKLSMKNLLDSKYKVASTFMGEDYIRRAYLLGRSISLSIHYSLN
jgi:TonB-dependent receptor